MNPSTLGASPDGAGGTTRGKEHVMMNHMDGWFGGGMWLWAVMGILVVVTLVVAIAKFSNKKS